MSKRTTISAISQFFGVFGSAINASRAVEGRRVPNARDLRALGIDPAHFKNIQL